MSLIISRNSVGAKVYGVMPYYLAISIARNERLFGGSAYCGRTGLSVRGMQSGQSHSGNSLELFLFLGGLGIFKLVFNIFNC